MFIFIFKKMTVDVEPWADLYLPQSWTAASALICADGFHCSGQEHHQHLGHGNSRLCLAAFSKVEIRISSQLEAEPQRFHDKVKKPIRTPPAIRGTDPMA